MQQEIIKRPGFTVFLTGLPASGKSSLAQVLCARLREIEHRAVTILDGDELRRSVCADLGFSKQDRDTNVRRVGSLAAEITRRGEVAICALIAPYESTRKEVQASIERWGGFLLVHLSTPIGVCEDRDIRGLYARARANLIENFTGVSDPYERPQDAAVSLDASVLSPAQGVDKIIRLLIERKYIEC